MTDLTVSFSPEARPRALADDAARDCSVALRLCDSGAGALSRPAPAAAPAGIAGEMARARASSPPVASPDFSRFTGCSLSGCGARAAWREFRPSHGPEIPAGTSATFAAGENSGQRGLPSLCQMPAKSGVTLGGSRIRRRAVAWATSQSQAAEPATGDGGDVREVASGSLSTVAGAVEVVRGVDVRGHQVGVVDERPGYAVAQVAHAAAVRVADLVEPARGRGDGPPGRTEPVRAARRGRR